MAAKEIAYDIDARERMLRGVQKLVCKRGIIVVLAAYYWLFREVSFIFVFQKLLSKIDVLVERFSCSRHDVLLSVTGTSSETGCCSRPVNVQTQPDLVVTSADGLGI